MEHFFNDGHQDFQDDGNSWDDLLARKKVCKSCEQSFASYRVIDGLCTDCWMPSVTPNEPMPTEPADRYREQTCECCGQKLFIDSDRRDGYCDTCVERHTGRK